jgi:hypothetical protein
MPRGRPRKYLTDRERAEARRRTNRDAVHAYKLRRTQAATRPDFVPYAPEPPDVPVVTPSGVGLRISPDIAVPCDPLDIDDGSDDEQPLALLRDDVEAADATSQPQASDREHTHEENEHEGVAVQEVEEIDARETLPLPSSDNNNTSPPAVTPEPIVQRPSVLAEVGSPAQSTSGASELATPPTERTAYKLAKQLRNFQGCTHEEHEEAERKHQSHHEQPDVHSVCENLEHITRLLRGVHNGGRPLPDVISNPEMMRKRSPLPQGLDLKAAFEGTSPTAYPEDAGTRNENLPRSLCLEQHYNSSKKGRGVDVTFDIDSVCCFPSSLAFARRGIEWYPRAYTTLNLDADIHFSLPVRAYNARNAITTKNIPLHKIPHYCFGAVTSNIRSLLVYVFFPELRMESLYKHSNFLSKQDQQLWLDAVLLPALDVLVPAARMKYYPHSEDIAAIDTTTSSKETLRTKDSSREQILPFTLRAEHLDRLWTSVLERIAEDPGLSRFEGATLFVNAKNTKLAHMGEPGVSLATTYRTWEETWNEVANPQFYSRSRTFVDIAKEVSSQDHVLPYDAVPDDFEAETFLWKRCCLESYARTRTKLLADGKHARGSPKVTTYPWATTRDSMGLILSAAPRRQEFMDGMVYSQFYGTIKSPFDVSKVYVFDNQAVENLALDPAYVASLRKQGGGISFSEKSCTAAYLHSKRRAAIHLKDSQRQSFGLREEHRASLALMDEVCNLWYEWDREDEPADEAPPLLPYYIVPSQELFDFLRAQINKYCLLFEHTLANTGKMVSLQETMVMVIALRALRFCYGSNMLAKESLLFKNRWERTRGTDIVVREGLGMKQTMANCGLGWFLPKFSWMSRRLAQPHGDNMLVGNLLMHAEYKRRWQAVKDLSDVYTRFHQATQWFERYNVERNPQLLKKWFEYLIALNLEQFDADVWLAMLAAHKTHPELSQAALAQNGSIPFCYRGMYKMFLEDGERAAPHMVTGNQMRITTVGKLLDFLFLWDDDRERKAWGKLPFRLVLRQSFEFIESRLGYQRASQWLDDYLYLVRLTHWILPYPSSNALIQSTKESALKGKIGRMMWFSSVFAHPRFVSRWCDRVKGKKPAPQAPLPKEPLLSLEPSSVAARLIRRAHNAVRPSRLLKDSWDDAAVLIEQCRKEGIGMLGRDNSEDYWVAGRVSMNGGPPRAVWEEFLPPTLSMRTRIRSLGLDDLEALMVTFTQEAPTTMGRGVAAISPTPSRRSVSIRDVIEQIERSESGSVFQLSESGR